MSHMTRKHITLWLGCNVCEACSKASMPMKLHREVDHKNFESITNFTSFFNRRNRLIGEKMLPMLRSTSSRQFLHHNCQGAKLLSTSLQLVSVYLCGRAAAQAKGEGKVRRAGQGVGCVQPYRTCGQGSTWCTCVLYCV